jgi:hypothetical protein
MVGRDDFVAGGVAQTEGHACTQRVRCGDDDGGVGYDDDDDSNDTNTHPSTRTQPPPPATRAAT